MEIFMPFLCSKTLSCQLCCVQHLRNNLSGILQKIFNAPKKREKVHMKLLVVAQHISVYFTLLFSSFTFIFIIFHVKTTSEIEESNC